MRRLALPCFVALAALAVMMPACGAGTPVTPPDLVSIKGQIVQGPVPAADAIVCSFDNSSIHAAVGDASLFPNPGPNVTDGNGHFVVGGYGTSYDLVIFPASSPRDATVVQNLTRRDPVVSLPLPQNMPVHTGHVQTTWAAPPPAGSSVAYFLQGPTYPGVELVGVVPVDSNYADGLTATWRGSYSTTVNIWAVAYMTDPTTKLPSSYLGYATTYAWLIDQRVSPFVVSLQKLSSSQATVNFQAPAGYSVETADLAVDLSAGTTTFPLAHFDAPNGTLTVNVPDLPFNRLLAHATAKNGGDTSSAAGIAVATPTTTPNISLAFPTPTTLSSPADGATSVDTSTTFSWSGTGVNEIIFTSTDAGAPSIRVVTTAQSMTLSQFQGLANAAIPAGSHYTWSARRWPDFQTVDAFEDPNVDLPNANSALSASRSFTFSN